MTDNTTTTADSDADLVARYEAIRRLARSPAKDWLLREIERRAARSGLVFDPVSQVGYQWQSEDDSVVRVIRSPEALRAEAREIRRLRSLSQSLGRQALDGPVKAISL